MWWWRDSTRLSVNRTSTLPRGRMRWRYGGVCPHLIHATNQLVWINGRLTGRSAFCLHSGWLSQRSAFGGITGRTRA